MFMNKLLNFFEYKDHRAIDKWHHYFEIYERYLNKYKDQNITILEIGVSHGGSLQMWNDYFGKGSQIYGVDINPHCKIFEEANVKIFIGSQSDRIFLRELKNAIPRLDILIDDGGHMMDQQKITFEELFDHVKDDGIYICEDLHTSYWLSHGGGYRRRGTFIEFSKNLIDYLHGWHSRQKNFKANKYSKSIFGLHFHDSILVIEKRNIIKPFCSKRGKPGFVEEPDYSNRVSFQKKVENYWNALLARFRIAKHF